MLRAVSITRAADRKVQLAFDSVILAQDGRHVRRKVLTLSQGEKVLIDLPEPVMLGDGDLLVLDDGRYAGILAAEEELYDIRGRDATHLTELAWHIGNRHLTAQIEADRILILRDHVIKAMLEGLGATVTDTAEIFRPLRGAYSGHAHGAAAMHDEAEPDHGHGRSRR